MDIPSSPVISSLVLYLRDQFRIENFVETGTYHAATAIWASRQFNQVYTIEAAHQLWEKASEKYAHIANVHFLYGDSRVHLKSLSTILNSSALFWLDAHYSGGDTFGATDECPLLSELEAIRSGVDNPFILIDDASYFLSPPPKPHNPTQWPDLTEIVASLTDNGKSDCYNLVLEEVIVSAPRFAREIVQAYAQDINTQILSNRSAIPRNTNKALLRSLTSIAERLRHRQV
jgi:hypothetical protein